MSMSSKHKGIVTTRGRRGDQPVDVRRNKVQGMDLRREREEDTPSLDIFLRLID